MGSTSKYDTLATVGAGRGAFWQTLGARLRDYSTLFRFAATGVIGYIAYQLVFLLLYESPLVSFLPDKGEELTLLGFSHGDARLLITTLIAAELSIVAVFTGHHLWTFRDRVIVHKPVWLRFAQFNAKATVSSLVILTLVVNLLTLEVGVPSYLAIPTGVATAFLWNLIWDFRFIWRPTARRNEGG